MGGTSGGNPSALFTVTGGQAIRAYIDNADSDIFKVVVGTGYPGVGSATNGTVGGISFNPATGCLNVGTTTGPPALGISEQITVSQYLGSTGRLGIFSGNVTSSGGAGFIATSNGGGVLSLETLGSAFAGTTLRTNASTHRLQCAGTLQINCTGASRHIVFGTNTTERGSFDDTGNFLIGTAAVATTATDGFLYVTSCAGTPTGVPTAKTGRVPIVVDTTNHKLYFYDGSWRDAGP